MARAAASGWAKYRRSPAGSQAQQFVRLLGFGGQKQDGHVGALAQLLADPQPVHPRHHHVQDHRIHPGVKQLQRPEASVAASGAASSAGTDEGAVLNIMLETEVQSLDPQVATDGTETMRTTSGIDYAQGTLHHVEGSHYVKCTDAKFAAWMG